MLEKIVKSSVNTPANRKYAVSYGLSVAVADIASQYILPNLLYDTMPDEQTVALTLAAKTIPFMVVSIARYWNSPQRNQVVVSQGIGAAITCGLGYPFYCATLSYALLPRPVAAAVLHIAGAVSFLARTTIDRHNGVHEFGPTPNDARRWVGRQADTAKELLTRYARRSKLL